ncbi:MAG: Fic family protein, partial [Acutalibacter sp.]|nr:Fic family protein [Acutalibacter sp.]
MLCEKCWQLQKTLPGIPDEVISKFDKAFEIEYAHNSTAIEGNTLTLVQTKAILEDGLS